MSIGFPENEDWLNKQNKRDEEEKARDAERGNRRALAWLGAGVTMLRIMPGWDETGRWFVEYQEHYVESEKKYVACPEFFGENCPLCNLGRQLVEAGDEASVKRGSKLRPRSQFLSNVIILSDARNENGVTDGYRVLKYPVTVKRAFLGHHNEWKGIISPELGYNMKVERVEGDFVKYNVMGMPPQSNIVEIMSQRGVDISQWKLHNLDDMVPRLAEEEIQKLADSFAGRTPQAAQPAVAPAPAQPVATAPATPAPTPAETPQVQTTVAPPAVGPPPVTSS